MAVGVYGGGFAAESRGHWGEGGWWAETWLWISWFILGSGEEAGDAGGDAWGSARRAAWIEGVCRGWGVGRWGSWRAAVVHGGLGQEGSEVCGVYIYNIYITLTNTCSSSSPPPSSLSSALPARPTAQWRKSRSRA